MKKIVIDKDYPGLIDDGWRYRIIGNLSAEIIQIDVPLFVTGSIKAGEWIKAGESIEACGWINSGRSIKAGGSINAGEWIEMGGIKTDNLYLFNGTFTFNVWIMDTHLKIGCKIKTKEEWLKIYSSEHGKDLAEKMGDNGSMWAIREVIKGFCS